MSARALDTGAVMRPAQADEPYCEQSDVDPAGGDSLVGKLAADLCDVVSHEAPEVDLVELGLSIALEARRRGGRANA